MAVTIVGAGAIGGVTGASLTRAGHDVLLVDQAADHVAAMNERGLEIATPAGAWSVPVRAVTPDALPSTSTWCAARREGAAHRDRARPHRCGSRRTARSCLPRTGWARSGSRRAVGLAGRSAAS
jgi:2-polyprenyl-6-methoxyphenol hydroxylase-like FAD-dependent oxidoreductase